MVLEGVTKAFLLSDKNFRVQGFKLKGICPRCGESYERDFGVHGLYTPTANEAYTVMCFCQQCGHSWGGPKLLLTLNLSVVP